jgi:hypothetical protein
VLAVKGDLTKLKRGPTTTVASTDGKFTIPPAEKKAETPKSN